MKFPGAPQGLKMACGENPKRVYGERKQAPTSRMGNVAGYRAQWVEAQQYIRDQEEYEKKLAAGDKDAKGAKDAKPPKRDIRLDTLAAVLRGEILVHIHCYRADEMATMLDMADEFGYRISAFHHAAEAYKIADLLAERGVCGAMWADWWGFKMEAFDGIQENIAFVDYPANSCAIVHSDSEEGIQRLNQEAAKAMGRGLRAGLDITPERAITWLTANPAKSLGIIQTGGNAGSGQDGRRGGMEPQSVQRLRARRTRVYRRRPDLRSRACRPATIGLSAGPAGAGSLAMNKLIKHCMPAAVLALALLGGGCARAGHADTRRRSAYPHRQRHAEKRRRADPRWQNRSAGRRPCRAARRQVIEANGRPLTPGLFGGLSAIGVDEVSGEKTTVNSGLSVGADQLKDADWRPEFDVTLSYNPNSVLVPIARIEGLTWTMLAPTSVKGGSFVAGQGAGVMLDGRYDAVLDGSRSLFVDLGSAGSPMSGGSRAAQYMLFEQAIRETRSPLTAGQRPLLEAAGREVLAQYLSGGRVVFHVERAVDIHRAIVFAKRFGMKPVIAGGAEAWMVAEELAAAGVPVLLDSLENLPEDFDRLGARLDNAAMLNRAGVRIAFIGAGSHNARKIRQLAGSAVAHGLPWDAALAALTSNPAQIFGVKASRGGIAAGQMADLVLWSGDPLELTNAADAVWIAGTAMEMRSRQTELRDRYLNILRNHAAR
ncbi:MAG: amidohydrolase family protein [Rhodospirillales bacterium]